MHVMHAETSCHGMWVSVQGQLELAPQQEHAMHAVHETLSSNLAQLLSERKTLVDMLQVLSGSPDAVLCAPTTTSVCVLS